MGYIVDWSVVFDNLDIFVKGAFLSLKISAFALILSIPIGIIIGLGRISRNKFISLLTSIYVEVFRGVPLLVLLLWIYFVLGSALRLGSYMSAILGLGLYGAAFIAEIVRAGIQAVPRGQMEAARSSGMTYIQAMRLIILPQAFRKILPPMASQFIILIKDSSLVSVIGVMDLTLLGRNIVTTSLRSLEVWTFIAVIYFLMTFLLSQIIRFFERKYKVAD
ncbi:amino acid ABC transporter permease [Bacillus sp. S/N-304-OC-R1]|uniref:amino acid ABC transporter permease n=1 Tax=Bacillus sp. S/N-304-OC-R1 TaxID=2758034 RepID=UPI001C8DB2B3|nr:amino acid ABC transporter permease [Bacillus sp. S/N-304-OC-R1]MBY0122918.1 amino acid ABC transporter permease [Bacillus sp. S/N-304-OC-R1]